jgi:hypothetical protein
LKKKELERWRDNAERLREEERCKMKEEKNEKMNSEDNSEGKDARELHRKKDNLE